MLQRCGTKVHATVKANVKMNVAVFNVANVGSSIKASCPSVRIISVGLPYIQSKELTNQLDVETRMLPVSRGPKSADGTGSEIHWKPISNECLSALDQASATIQMQLEYESINDRVAKWNKLRDSIDAEVTKAAQDKVMRSVNQVRAEALLAMLRGLPEVPESETGPVAMPEVKFDDAKFVPKLSRDMETVGQTWALIAILGDSVYSTKKSEILDAIGSSYFEFLKESTGLDDENEAEARWHSESTNSLEPFLQKLVMPMADALRDLTEEPLVAFFDSSDDAEALNKKAEQLSKAPELKHADIAIVRMYTWLNLRMAQSHRIEHKTRGSNASAAEFFAAMRSAISVESN